MKKFVISTLLLSLSLSLVSCGPKNLPKIQDTEETLKNIETENYEITNDDELPMIDGGLPLGVSFSSKDVKYLTNYKNKNYEITINTNEYTEEELFKTIAPTCVYIKNTFESHKVSKSGGSIYDIDDNNIYILSCGHGFYPNDTSKFIDITFFTNETITITVENVAFVENIDCAMYKIPKNLVTHETLNSIKSINIDNYLNKTRSDFVENTTLINFSFIDKQWSTHYMSDFSYKYDATNNKGGFIVNNTNIVKGCSGSGLFDENGNYYGYVIKRTNYGGRALYYVKDLIVQLNPDYFNEQ